MGRGRTIDRWIQRLKSLPWSAPFFSRHAQAPSDCSTIEHQSSHAGCSLSPREGVRVRGNKPHVCPNRIRPSNGTGYVVTNVSALVRFSICRPTVCLFSLCVFLLLSLTLPTTAAPPLLECGNLIYSGNKSSVCFADRFLTDVDQQTNLRVNKKFCPVRLDSEALFDYPFAVMSGNENFSLTERERIQLRKYLLNGGFLLVSPGCSDTKWDRAFRREIKICFPQYDLARIPMDHPIFNVVNRIPRLTDKHGKTVMIEGLQINGRLVMVYSTEGLNDVAHAKGCCCCGGNEIAKPALVNVNVFTYAVLY